VITLGRGTDNELIKTARTGESPYSLDKPKKWGWRSEGAVSKSLLIVDDNAGMRSPPEELDIWSLLQTREGISSRATSDSRLDDKWVATAQWHGKKTGRRL